MCHKCSKAVGVDCRCYKRIDVERTEELIAQKGTKGTIAEMIHDCLEPDEPASSYHHICSSSDGKCHCGDDVEVTFASTHKPASGECDHCGAGPADPHNGLHPPGYQPTDRVEEHNMPVSTLGIEASLKLYRNGVRYDDDTNLLLSHIDRLEAQNKKLREALERIADDSANTYYSINMARKALEEDDV